MQRLVSALIAAGLVLVSYGHGLAASSCPVERDAPLVPQDKALCESLEASVRKPSALPLDAYEDKLTTFLRNFCHHEASGWKSDKRLRDTGPFIGSFHNGSETSPRRSRRRRGRRSGLRARRWGRDSLSHPACRAWRRAGDRARGALLPGDPALLFAGSLLHVEKRGHQAALLHRRQARRVGPKTAEAPVR